MSGLRVPSSVWTCVFDRPELTGKWLSHRTDIKFLKFKT